MEYEELKKLSNEKILYRAKSGYGKTFRSARIVLMVLSEGIPVKYVDTEAEGSGTMVRLIEQGEFDKDVVELLDYVRVGGFDEFMDEVSHEEQEKYGLIVVDTLDHKHTYALREVTGERKKSDADWNQYPAIYDTEKRIMEILSKPRCNIVATIDPESGSMDKPKGGQTNVHGYFSVVVDLTKSGDGWDHRIRNFVGQSQVIGKKVPGDLEEKLADIITERSQAVEKITA